MAEVQPREVDSKVAKEMAEFILFNLEEKYQNQVSREEYLRTVHQCVMALKGYSPKM